MAIIGHIRLGKPFRVAALALGAFTVTVILYPDLLFPYMSAPQPSAHTYSGLISQVGVSIGKLEIEGGAEDILRFVKPLIGTVNGGHVFPGATLPYGMAKACPDSLSPAENAAGYVSDDYPILGFSQMHDSGTGGQPSLGNFPLFLHSGCPSNDPTACAYSQSARKLNRIQGSAIAHPGYFSLSLVNGVTTEMTAAMHTNLFRFNSPAIPKSYMRQGHTVQQGTKPVLLVDIYDLMGSRSTGGGKVDREKGRMTGWGRFRPSFGNGGYRAFFCADVKDKDKIFKSGTFTGNKVNNLEQRIPEEMANKSGGGPRGLWMQFDESNQDHEILVRVGLSFISEEQACANAETEIPTFDFEGTQRMAEEVWREKLGAVVVDARGVDEDFQIIFWSGLYRSLLSPQNYTGENPLWQSTEPYFDSFYCIWDSFRAQHPLLSIIDPSAQMEMVRTLLDVYRFEGKLPDCRMQFSKGYTQGGSNADIVIADAYIKGLTNNINWTLAYEAVVSDAEIVSGNWGVEGRGNLDSWIKYGYLASDHYDHLATGPHSRTVSRTVEYAYDDFCIAQLAHAMGGRAEDEAKYLNRSGFWKNLYNPEQLDSFLDPADVTNTPQFTGYKGFLMPRLMNGTFLSDQYVRTCSPVSEMHRCYYDTQLHTYEGSPWLYTFFVPQDMAGLIKTLGGPDAFVSRLNYFHESNIAYMGNEQSFLTVYQFHYGGRPALSAHWVSNYIPAQFNTTTGGIPGNDDCAMGAFSSMAMMGFFPVAGQSVYLLSVPFFPEVRLRTLRGGAARPTIIRKIGTGKYIQSVTRDGQPWFKNWIDHSFFADGGVLEIVAGDSESEWGTKAEDLPPSYPHVVIGTPLTETAW